jgi:hypothetical protein
MFDMAVSQVGLVDAFQRHLIVFPAPGAVPWGLSQR